MVQLLKQNYSNNINMYLRLILLVFNLVRYVLVTVILASILKVYKNFKLYMYLWKPS